MAAFRRSFAAIFLLVTVALTGCQLLNSGGSSDDNASLIARSADKLQEGAPYHFQAKTTLRESASSQTPTLQIDTEGDVASLKRARFALSSPQEPDFKLEVILFDDAMFVRSAGEPWEELPATQLGELGPSPLDTIACLRAITGSVEDKGAESLEGVQTRRLTVALDSKAISKQMEKLGRPIAAEAVKNGAIEVWLSQNDALTHRALVTLDLSSPSGGASGKLELDTRSTNHGKSVDIQKPAVG